MKANHIETRKSGLARALPLCIALLAIAALTPASASADSCSNLASLTLPNITITTAQSITGGSFTPPGSTTLTGLPDFCRVAAVAAPTSDSNIEFEVWIPESGWNGKYLQLGCGGFCGAITYSSMPDPLSRGYAVAATDDGHQDANELDASWAVGHPQKLIDFAYRAVKETGDNSKAIIQAFESSGISRSYFDGCSDGGREARMEAQRYPDDFTGIIAGSPASSWTHLVVGGLWDLLASNKTTGSALLQSDVDLLSAAVLKKCAGHDGGLATDLFLNNPQVCNFNTETLLCTRSQTTNCLTQAKIDTINAFYSGPFGIAPGNEMSGAENNPLNWPEWLTGNGTPMETVGFFFVDDFFQSLVFPNITWTLTSYSVRQNTTQADEQVGVIDSIDPNLFPFQSNRGKLIQYVGWADTGIPPQNDVDYYDSVTNVMGGLERTEQFYRLFMVPGMSHCGGGPGANAFGDGVNGPNPADPSDDIISALDQWVENGTAPDSIVATKYVNDDPASGIAFQRPLCPYPQFASYKGKGDPTQAENWTCANPNGKGGFPGNPGGPPHQHRQHRGFGF